MDKALPEFALYAVSNLSPPPYTMALWTAERFRTILLGIASRHYGYDYVPSAFHGRNTAGEFLKSNHSHASFMCSPDETGQFIAHMLVHFPTGIRSKEQIILMDMKRFWYDGLRSYQVKLLGFLNLAEISEILLPTDCITGTSTTWESLTPYLLTRHLHIKRSEKRLKLIRDKAIDRELRKQLMLELSNRNYIDPCLIRSNSTGLQMRHRFIPWSSFDTTRLKGSDKQVSSLGYGFEIEFPEAVSGPLSLGYGCHFSLGLFRPVRDA